MAEIILWALLAFFGAFGLVEFVRFVYTDWNNNEGLVHTVIRGDKTNENIEYVVRNTLLSTDSGNIIIIKGEISTEDGEILNKLQEKYQHLEVMDIEEYINYLRK